MTYPLLGRIQAPGDVKRLQESELPALCEEIRQFLIESVSATGGHLSSNLGVVELTVALHRALDLPQDKILFDVGHQCYTHKLLTGRMAGFAELRQKKMVTPFFIWANYDIEEQTNMQISANYLSAYALNALGCSTSGFDQMRLALQQQIPVMNVNGYRLPDGTWYPQSEQPENDLLNDYHHAEYAQIFDAKNRSDEWYITRVIKSQEKCNNMLDKI